MSMVDKITENIIHWSIIPIYVLAPLYLHTLNERISVPTYVRISSRKLTCAVSDKVATSLRFRKWGKRDFGLKISEKNREFF